MSGVFMDGGGSDSMNLGGDGIDHGGHDHGSHGVHHGHGQGGHNFLAQILGLDQADHAHLAHHGGEGAEGLAPSQSASWNSALQGLKLENLIAGINITPNFLLFMLFACFVGWLGVIYWIRHHEPFANQVLGSSAAFAPTVGADRVLINSARDANPIKTSAESGLVYSPQPTQNSGASSGASQTNSALTAAMFGQTQAAAPALASGAAPAAAPNVSPVNQGLTSAMSAAFGGASPQPSLNAAVAQNASPVNQGLSAAMSSALGPASAPVAAPQSGASPYAPGYPSASSGYAPGQSALGQSIPMSGSMSAAMPGAMPGPGAMNGSMRLFTNTRPAAMPMSAGAMPMSAGPGAGMPEGGMRLFSSRRSMMAQAPPQAPAESPAPPAAIAPAPVQNPNAWSLANQGNGTFSSDTAQFNSQFGAPLVPPAADVTSSNRGAAQNPASAVPSGTYAVSTPEGTRVKLVTDK
jgi:hypothetical protein